METFELTHFDDFTKIAQQQTEPQKLLLVLAERELPVGHTPEQAQAFSRGEGGHLAPIAAIDKRPEELNHFSEFVEEANQVGKAWNAVFVAALPGAEGKPPTNKAVDEAIEKMLHGIRNGMISQYLVFDREGKPLNLSQG